MATKEEDFVARLFVASTHQPVLYFSSQGPSLQGEGLAAAARRAAGARQSARQSAAARTGRAHHHDHAAARGRGELGSARRDVRDHARHVRRNKLSDFAQVNRAGKIAMKLDEGEGIVDVQICSENDDVLLTTNLGQCIRFAVADVRVFKGRDSMGVRGITLAEGDSVISLAILREFDARRRGALGLSQDAPRDGGRDRAEEAEAAGERGRRERGAGGRRGAAAGTLCRNVGRRAVHPHDFGERLRQTHLVVRISAHRARRQRHRRDGGQRRATASSSPRSRWSTATRSCSSPTAAS